jgi:hypothetical protein
MLATRRAHVPLMMPIFFWWKVAATNLHFAKRALQPLSDSNLVIRWQIAF